MGELKEMMVIGLLLTVCSAFCPSPCKCDKNTYDCVQCLQSFLRIYNTATNQCQCLEGYVEKTPVEDYCCPQYCSSCCDLGCTSCFKNFEIQYDSNLWIYRCVCKKNYVLNNGACVCRSYFQPTLYYQIPLMSKCLACPVNCTCTNKGCQSCLPETSRAISQDIYGNKNCLCRSPLVQINGVCQCLPNCTCDIPSKTITCAALSNRILNQTGWVCRKPFVDVNGICTCVGIYTFKSITHEAADCYCNSYFAPMRYYQSGGICYQCTEGCVCNEKGCMYCEPGLNRDVGSFKCPCKVPYVEFNGVCVCVEPYYLYTDSNGTTTCRCLSFYNNTAYVWNNWTLSCFKCPTRCKCNHQGCVECAEDSLRRIAEVWGLSQCPCIQSAEQVLGVCQCNSYAYPTIVMENVSSCACKNLPQVYKYVNYCSNCPEGCKCNGTGCYYCDPKLHRSISQTRSLILGFMCECQPSYIQDNGICICRAPKVWNSTTTGCDCVQPYITVGVTCVCKSVKQPTKYYYDSMKGTCHPCPIGCECNATGCFNCFPYTLRANFWSGELMQCPCLQTALLVDEVCTICPKQSYHLAGECIECPTCQSCNFLGCISCFIGSKLNTTNASSVTCTCINSSLINIRGKCSCKAGQYKDGDGYCQACPNNCLDCTYDNGNLTCISCRTGVHRYNSPLTGCPCQKGYSELGQIKQYCCPNQCTNCDDNGCTQCPLFSFRTLVNNSCLCINNLVSNTTINCTCPSNSYLFIDQCIECPKYCDKCYYSQIQDKVRCLSCNSDMNRQLDTDLNCPCNPYYIEADPILNFCYPKYCSAVTPVCEKCTLDRIPNENGTRCLCQRGWYETVYSECKLCNMEGCLECSSSSFCTLCDRAQGYYLTNTSCKYNLEATEYLFSQSTEGISLQIKSNIDVNDYKTMLEMKVFLETVIDKVTSGELVDSAYNLTIVSIETTKTNTIILNLENPNITFTKNMLTVAYTFTKRPVGLTGHSTQFWEGFDEKGRFLGMNEKIFIYLQNVYSDEILNSKSKWKSSVTISSCSLLLLLGFFVYVRGLKHNEIIFFLQTLSFIGLTCKDSQMLFSPFLYNLKICYYGIGDLLSFLIPDGYLQHSFGNFVFFTGDSNIMRVAGTPIILALAVCIFSIGARIVFLFYQNSKEKKCKCLGNLIKRHKKSIYRGLEYLFKTTMYPLLFFSIVTLKNWKARIMEGNHYSQFQRFSQYFSFFMISLYTVMTILSVSLETIAKIHKFENGLEYLASLLSSLIIVFSHSTNLFILVIVVLIFRGGAYVFLRKKYLRDFQVMEYTKMLSVGLEVTTVGLILNKDLILLIIFMFLTVVSHIVHGESVVYFTNQMADIGKRCHIETDKISPKKVVINIEPGEINNSEDTTVEDERKCQINIKSSVSLNLSNSNFQYFNETPDPINETNEDLHLPRLNLVS